jgi:hypothetical protein
MGNQDDPGGGTPPPQPPGAPAGQPTAYAPAPGGQAGYPAPGTQPFYQSSGIPAGYPGPAWAGPGYAPPPASQSPGFGLRLTAMILALAGGILLIVGSLLPYVHYSFQISDRNPSLLNPGPGVSRWFAAEPVGVACLAIVAGLVMLAVRSHGVRWAAAGALLAWGVQSVLMFAGLWFGEVGSGITRASASAVGLAGGALLLAAAVAGLIGTAAGQRAAAAGAAAGQPGLPG